MADGKLCCVMALRTGESIRIDMTVMPTRIEAVIFSGAISVTCCALTIYVDYARIPYRCRLTSVAAHVRTRSIGISPGDAAF